MSGYGRAYGAITVINSFATGYGAAIGINLKTEVFIKKALVTKINTFLFNKKLLINTNLIRNIINLFRKKYGLTDELNVEIYSEIPPEVGLKSSSAVVNAVILGLFDYLGYDIDHMDVLKLNSYISKKSNVSITGAFDDAAASLFGGLVITDNNKNVLIDKKKINKYDVLLTYPHRKVKTIVFKNKDFSPIKGLVNIAYGLLLHGSWEDAMILNGFIYSNFLGYNTIPLLIALKNGAIAVSLNGKGPSYAAITEDVEKIRREWDKVLKCRFIRCNTR